MISKKELGEISKRWTQRARTGEWEKTLKDTKSYVNEDDAYNKFEKVLKEIIDKKNLDRFIDLCCGDANIWQKLNLKSYSKCVGVDFSEGMIELAKKNIPDATFFVEDAVNSIDLIKEKTKLVFSRGVVINHVGLNHFMKIIDNAYTLLEEDGLFIFDFLNETWFKDPKNKQTQKPLKPYFTLKKILTAIDQTQFRSPWLDVYYIDGRSPIVILKKKSIRGKPIYFMSKNEDKVSELGSLFLQSGYDVRQLNIENMEDIDTTDVSVVSRFKAEKAHEITGLSIFCSDTGLYIEELKGYPGVKLKDALKKEGLEGMLKRLEGKVNRKAILRSVLTYVTKDGKYKQFGGEIIGNLAKVISIKIKKEFLMDSIFVPLGSNKPIGEMDENEYLQFATNRVKVVKDLSNYLLTKKN